jgi:hypothetical protein
MVSSSLIPTTRFKFGRAVVVKPELESPLRVLSPLTRRFKFWLDDAGAPVS